MSISSSPLILYATETGTAQDTANYIARQLRRAAFRCRVHSIDAFPSASLLSEPLIIFIISTTGAGAAPRAMRTLWSLLLRADLPADLFDGLAYAVFGLGDTAYEHFCWPAKQLARRMEGLGAREVCARGEGDEQHLMGIDGALQPWAGTLLDELIRMYPLPPGVDLLPADQIPPPRVHITDTRDWGDPHSTDEDEDRDGDDTQHHTAVVCVNKRITATDWFQDVRHLELNIDSDALHYAPGDIAVIYPIAAPTSVGSFLSSMDWSTTADTPFSIFHATQDQTLPAGLPHITTLRTLFSRHLDFDAVPRRSFFQLLRCFTADGMERERLDEFLATDGADELYEYCYRVRRTIREILADFHHVRIPREYVFDVFPPMRPRHFSIASSMQRYPRQVHLCVAIVRYRTKLKVPRRGVCTTYLAGLHPGDTLRIGVQPGLIKLPPNPQTPVLCIGPGTGVAPMRAVLQERIHTGSSANTLYFGCRSASKDQHYAAEWAAHAARGDAEYRMACSRDATGRVYVQDMLRTDGPRVWELVGIQRAWVYIAGSANKMPRAVKEALGEAVALYGGYTVEAAERYVQGMVEEGRLMEECWS